MVKSVGWTSSSPRLDFVQDFLGGFLLVCRSQVLPADGAGFKPKNLCACDFECYACECDSYGDWDRMELYKYGTRLLAATIVTKY